MCDASNRRFCELYPLLKFLLIHSYNDHAYSYSNMYIYIYIGINMYIYATCIYVTVFLRFFSSRYPQLCWLIDNLTFKNTFQYNFYAIQAFSFDNISRMEVILFRRQFPQLTTIYCAATLPMRSQMVTMAPHELSNSGLENSARAGIIGLSLSAAGLLLQGIVQTF